MDRAVANAAILEVLQRDPERVTSGTRDGGGRSLLSGRY